jgi:hypothetical protein
VWKHLQMEGMAENVGEVHLALHWWISASHTLFDLQPTELSFCPRYQRLLCYFVSQGILTIPGRTCKGARFTDMNTFAQRKIYLTGRNFHVSPRTHLRHSISPFFSGIGTGIIIVTGTPIIFAIASAIGRSKSPAVCSWL